jgi:MFS family permease
LPTRQSFIVEMTNKDDLINAIALNSAIFNGARMVGPAVAGLLVDRYGVAPAFGLNGLSFLAVIVALLAMRAEGLPRREGGTTVRQEIAVGLRYAVGTPQVALILSLLLTVSLFVINHNVMVPLLARDVLHEGAHGFGLLMAALGTGSMVGALAIAGTGRSRIPLALLMAAAVALSALTLALAAIRSFWTALIVLALVGLSQIVFMASCNTTLQTIVPDRLRGRIMSVYAFVFAGVTPIGSLFVGSVAEWLGVSAAYAAGGGTGLILVVALALVWTRGRRGAQALPEA